MVLPGQNLIRHDDGVWTMSASGRQTKNGECLTDYPLPLHVGRWLDTYMRVRPQLLGASSDSGHLLLTMAGKPRTDISTLCSGLVCELVGVPVSPHQFRHIVATAMFHAGKAARMFVRCVRLIAAASNEADVEAMTASMLTSRSTLFTNYVRVHPSAHYQRAQSTLDNVLGKRAFESGDEQQRATRPRTH